MRLLLTSWLPVLVWMAVIFSASSDSQSSRRTSRLIGPLLRWLLPGIADETVNRVQFIVRKGAHVTEFAVLAALLWRACRATARDESRPWRGREAAFALGLATLYAASDEIHQSFVPAREARAADVLWDTGGAALGLFAVGRWQRRRVPRLVPP